MTPHWLMLKFAGINRIVRKLCICFEWLGHVVRNHQHGMVITLNRILVGKWQPTINTQPVGRSVLMAQLAGLSVAADAPRKRWNLELSVVPEQCCHQRWEPL